MKNFIFSAAVMALMTSGYSYSEIINSGGNIISNDNCLYTTVQITNITPNPEPAGWDDPNSDDNNDPNVYPINATSCLGYVTSPDNDWGNGTNPNIGGLGDGLLNGEVNQKGYYIGGGDFLNHASDSMVDTTDDGIDNPVDPGWIRLGGQEGGGAFSYDSIGDYNLSEVITVGFSMDGTWSLSVDPAAIGFATEALGRPSVFDHLAFVMKGPNDGNNAEEFGEWAIYDFNFYELIDGGLDISLGDTAYTFTGIWDSNGIFNGKDLSHVSIWAHDPPAGITTTTYVPEPTPLILMGLSLVLLVCRRKLSH